MTITLTREEAQQVLNALENFCEYGAILKPLEVRDLLRAKLSEPEPEPVAVCILKTLVGIDKNGIEEWKEELLYTAPPQRKECQRCGEVNPAEIHTCTPKREWVGLTDDEKEDMLKGSKNAYDAVERIEAKLKEKNA